MLDNQQIQNNWPQIKSQVLSKWNKLSEADVEKTRGDSSTLGKLVQSKYGSDSDFDTTYDKICSSLPKSIKAKNDIENRDATLPSAEAGMPHAGTEDSFDEALKSGSPERKMNSNYAKVDHGQNFNREADDELSAYTTTPSRTSQDDEESEEYIKLDSEKANIQFTTPDEFYPSQDPSPSREDITLGRNTSSATKQSTAQAAPISSEVSSNDAKKKL